MSQLSNQLKDLKLQANQQIEKLSGDVEAQGSVYKKMFEELGVEPGYAEELM